MCGYVVFIGLKVLMVIVDDGMVIELWVCYVVVVSIGSVVLLFDILGFVEVFFWMSCEVISVMMVLVSFVILGGGVVGCEMVIVYVLFGCCVMFFFCGVLLSG